MKIAVGSKEGAPLSRGFEKTWVSTPSAFCHPQKTPIQKNAQISLKLAEAEITSIHNVGFLLTPNRHTQNASNDIYSTPMRKP